MDRWFRLIYDVVTRYQWRFFDWCWDCESNPSQRFADSQPVIRNTDLTFIKLRFHYGIMINRLLIAHLSLSCESVGMKETVFFRKEHKLYWDAKRGNSKGRKGVRGGRGRKKACQKYIMMHDTNEYCPTKLLIPSVKWREELWKDGPWSRLWSSLKCW